MRVAIQRFCMGLAAAGVGIAAMAQPPTEGGNRLPSALLRSTLDGVGGIRGVVPMPKLGSELDTKMIEAATARLERVTRGLREFSDNPTQRMALRRVLSVAEEASVLNQRIMKSFFLAWQRASAKRAVPPDPNVAYFVERMLKLFEAGPSIPSGSALWKVLGDDPRIQAVRIATQENGESLLQVLAPTLEERSEMRDELENDPQFEAIEKRAGQLMGGLSRDVEVMQSWVDSMAEDLASLEASSGQEASQPAIPEDTLKLDTAALILSAERLGEDYANSFAGQLCGTGQGTGTRSETILQLATTELLANAQKNDTVLTAQLGFDGLVGVRKRGVKQASAKNIPSVKLILTEDTEPKAYVARGTAAALGPRITVTTGLVDAMCERAAVDVQVKVLVEKMKELGQESGTMTLQQFLNTMVVGRVERAGESPTLAAIELRRREASLALAVSFVIGHELAHLIYDPEPPPASLTAKGREWRADAARRLRKVSKAIKPLGVAPQDISAFLRRRQPIGDPRWRGRLGLFTLMAGARPVTSPHETLRSNELSPPIR